MSNYDPVDFNIYRKVFKIDANYIDNNKYIFNRINSYLRPQKNGKTVPAYLYEMSDVKNGMNERLGTASIDRNFKIHNKFLKEGNKVVDMDDYKKEFEPKEEKEEMPEILHKSEKKEKEINEKEEKAEKKEEKEDVESITDLNKFSNKKGNGKVKPYRVGNKNVAGFNFIGLDIGNEFKPDMKKLQIKRGGARTGFPTEQNEVTKEYNKDLVNNVKNYISNNMLDKSENNKFVEASKSMTGATLERKIGGGRAEYQKKLKEIREKHKCSLKEAMQIYKQQKNK